MLKKQNIPDLPNSTYWWIIYLPPGNKVEELTGYSKFQNQAEAHDKIRCLMGKICMLEKNGYIQKAVRIEIYKKLGPFPNKQADRHILTLKPNEWYTGEDRLILKIPFELKTFLNEFYKCVRENKPVEHLLPLPPKDFSKDDLYQMHKYNFRTMDALHEWCTKMLSNGEPRDRVLNFYTNYSTKYLQP